MSDEQTPTEMYLPLVEAARLGAEYAYSKEPRMTTALLILTGVNVVLTGTTLTVVAIGAKKARQEIEIVKKETNQTVANMKGALRGFADALNFNL